MSTRIEGKNLIVEWCVQDGYVSGGREHEVRVPLCDIEYLDEDEALDIIGEYVEESFRDKVSAGWDHNEVVRVLREKENGQ